MPCSVSIRNGARRVHVGILYILRAQRNSHIPTVSPKYIPDSYIGPWGSHEAVHPLHYPGIQLCASKAHCKVDCHQSLNMVAMQHATRLVVPAARSFCSQEAPPAPFVAEAVRSPA